MKRLKLLRKPEGEKKRGTVSLGELRGRDKKLYETLIFCGLLAPGPPSKMISLREAIREARKLGETERKNQAAAWWLIAARRALFEPDHELLERTISEYEAITGKRLLEKEEMGRAVQLVREYYPNVGAG